jgi:hypothetical protein
MPTAASSSHLNTYQKGRGRVPSAFDSATEEIRLFVQQKPSLDIDPDAPAAMKSDPSVSDDDGEIADFVPCFRQVAASERDGVMSWMMRSCVKNDEAVCQG